MAGPTTIGQKVRDMSFACSMRKVDVVYVAVSRADVRLARCCLASVKHHYPEVPVRLLLGGGTSSSFIREVQRHWAVGVEPIETGNYGWGFVKLEPLFGRRGERFLVLDSDTVATGPVFDLWSDPHARFVVNLETPSDAEIKEVYYDWEKLSKVSPPVQRPDFVFNSGQWFGTAGVLERGDFSPWIEWTFPRRLKHPECFMGGDQGVLNYVINSKVQSDGMRIECVPLMLWPKRGMCGLSSGAIADGRAPALIVHWAGIKRAMHRDMLGHDLLEFYETLYYKRIRWGGVVRKFHQVTDVLIHQWLRMLCLRGSLVKQYKLMPLLSEFRRICSQKRRNP